MDTKLQIYYILVWYILENISLELSGPLKNEAGICIDTKFHEVQAAKLGVENIVSL